MNVRLADEFTVKGLMFFLCGMLRKKYHPAFKATLNFKLMTLLKSMPLRFNVLPVRHASEKVPACV